MRVQILKSIASTSWSYAPGEIVELDDDRAEKWIVAGIAARLGVPEQVETTVKEPPERAVRKTAKRR